MRVWTVFKIWPNGSCDPPVAAFPSGGKAVDWIEGQADQLDADRLEVVCLEVDPPRVWVVTMVPKRVEAMTVAVCSTKRLARKYAAWFRERWKWEGKISIERHKLDGAVELEGLKT